MKKITFLLCFMFLICTFSLSYATELDLFSEGAILIDYDTLEVLYEKNSNQQFFPASTTKIMTGILAIENSNLNDIVTIDQETVDLADGTHIALESGEQLTMKNLLDALLIESANDSAIAIAKHVSGSVENFTKLMNEKAKSLGALNTNFVNPNGLPDENHLTTPYDLAIIARYAMENDTFKDIVKNYKAVIPITNKKAEQRYLNSSNRMLYSNEKILVDDQYVPIRYDGVNGVKSGFTKAAEYCLVTSFDKNGQKFIVVTFKSNRNNIYSDTHKLLNYGIGSFNKTKIGFKGKFVGNLDIKNGVIPIVPAITKTDSFYIVGKEHIESLEEKVIANKDLKAPLAKDEVIGRIEYLIDGKVVGKADIVSTIDIREVRPNSLFSSILDKWYVFIFFIFIILRILILNDRKKRRIKKRKSATYNKNPV